MSRTALWILGLVLSTFAARTMLDCSAKSGTIGPLTRLPKEIGPWRSVGDEPIAIDVRQILHADDALARTYQAFPGVQVQLFISYYSVQRAGEMMHSPRNCLPGSGWEPLSLSLVHVALGGSAESTVNRYLVEKDGVQMLTFYWYQEHGRIVSSELAGKAALMWDSIRLHSRDGALVRVSMMLGPNMDEDDAAEVMRQFLRSAGPSINHALSP
jgi:EpsI family protein